MYCYRNPQNLEQDQNSVAEFTNENIVLQSESVSNDSLTIQFYVSLPEEVSKPEDAATTHVLPLATLEEVFTENGDIIKGYTLSSSLAAANSNSSVATPVDSSGESKWKHLFFGGGGAVVLFGFILTFVLCLGLVVYKWKQKKR